MAPSRSLYSESFSSIQELSTTYGMIQGQGAVAPVVAPTTFSATSAKGFMSRSINWISLVPTDITRSGVGVYTAKFVENMPYVADLTPSIWGPSGLWGTIIDYNPTTRVVSFQTFAAAGAAADLTVNDFLRFTITGSFTVPPY